MQNRLLPKLLKISVLALLGLLITWLGVSPVSGQEQSVAKIIFLYKSSDCQECPQLLKQDLPTLLAPFGTQVEQLAIDISEPVNKSLLDRLQKKFNHPMDQVPMVIIGEAILVGRQQINSELNLRIQEALNNGGVDYPFVTPSEAVKETNWIPLIAVSFIGLLMLAIVGALLFQAQGKIGKLVDQEKKLRDSNTKLYQQVKKLEDIVKKLNEKVELPSADEISDTTLETLIGLRGSSVDFLSEAQRILYWSNKEKRPADDTIKDANGYLITLLRTIASATGIKPLATYQQIVQFDERYHTSDKAVTKNENVKVVETGWSKDNVVIKKAVVEKI